MVTSALLQENQSNTFVCDCEEWMRTACAGEGYYKEHEGKRYCVLHYPIKEKAEDFKIVLEKKVKSEDFDFSGVWFPDRVNFDGVYFSADANFIFATFSADADFNKATFSADTNFAYATFRADADFSYATFGADADFGHVTFDAVANFESATFKDYAYFVGSSEKRTLGDHPQLDFQFAIFEKPDRVSFHTLDLQPHWFINVDSRKFAFTDAKFKYDLKEEIKFLKEALHAEFKYDRHRLLAIACRQLAVNAEENHRYPEASRLRYSSFDVRRIERYYGFVPWRLDWWYWLASGYGESVSRAFIVFLVLIGSFTIGYKYSDFDPSSKTASTKPAQADTNPPSITQA